MKIIDGIPVFGNHDEKTLAQLRDVASRAARAAIMADGHLGYIMPVGGVAAYPNSVSVAGVGYDIGCGNAAIRTNLQVHEITDNLDLRSIESNPHRLAVDKKLNAFADQIARTISFGIGRKNNADDAPVEDPLFLDPAWYGIPNIAGYRDELREKARRQLGTVGSGNHYVDVFVDEADSVWVGVHFGSRGFGHTIASNFLALAQGGTWGDRVKEVEALLSLATPLGHDYWQLMQLAGRYAYAGREWVARKVVSILGGQEDLLVHNHHNFAWKEEHLDSEGAHRELVVVRKGATPAFPGQKGFVGGSMGDNAVILEGASDVNPEGFGESEERYHTYRRLQHLSMFSTVHGAGRVMSRTEAAGKRNRKTGELKRPGKISPEMMNEWLGRTGVILRGGGLDEAPQAYRRLPEVLTEQGRTVNVLHTLRPIVVVMAGANEFDPYKD